MENGNLKCKQLQIAVLLYKVSLPPLGNQLPKMLGLGTLWYQHIRRPSATH